MHSEARAEGGSGDGQRAGEQEGAGAGELRGGSSVNGGLGREKAVHRGGNGVAGKKARGPIVPGIGVTLVEDVSLDAMRCCLPSFGWSLSSADWLRFMGFPVRYGRLGRGEFLSPMSIGSFAVRKPVLVLILCAEIPGHERLPWRSVNWLLG